jgi:hypothetical protein
MGLVAAVTLPAILARTVPIRWLKPAMLAWTFTPAIGYAAIVLWEMLTRPATGNPLGHAFFGFLLLASVIAIPWLIVCGVGFAIGCTLRRRSAPVPSAPAQQASAEPKMVATKTPASRIIPHTVEMAGWRSCHIGFQNDGLRIGGADVWTQKWRRVDTLALQLPHPTYPTQRHRYDIYEMGDPAHPIRFAVSELSNGVWGFFVPVSEAASAGGISADGSLRFEQRIGPYVNGRYDSVSGWAVLIEVASELVLLDCAGWASSRITGNPDGSLFLHLQQSGFEVLFQIDPLTRQFRNQGDGGQTRPLSDLSDAVEQARLAIGQDRAVPQYRRISPDGAIRVDLATVEWANSHWVNSPRVIALPGGDVLLDLWGTDWDAVVSFPGHRRVRLDLRRYHAGGNLTVDLDSSNKTYQIVAESGHDGALEAAPLTGIINGIEASARRVAARAMSRGGSTIPRGDQGHRRPWAAWRTALAILAGALLAIGLATYVSLHFFPATPQQLTPLPMMPSPAAPVSQ